MGGVGFWKNVDTNTHTYSHTDDGQKLISLDQAESTPSGVPPGKILERSEKNWGEKYAIEKMLTQTHT